jgi:hypothetical protein
MFFNPRLYGTFELGYVHVPNENADSVIGARRRARSLRSPAVYGGAVCGGHVSIAGVICVAYMSHRVS